MTKYKLFAVGLIILVFSSLNAQATVINVDLQNDPALSSSQTYSGQGAMAAPGSIWNSVHPGFAPDVYFWGEIAPGSGSLNSFAPVSLLDSEGNATSVTVSLSTSARGIYTWTGYDPANTSVECTSHLPLMNDWLINESDSSWITVTIGGLTPNGLYDLVVYGHSHESAGNTVFSIGGNEQTTGIAAAQHSLTEGIDYLTFNSITADAFGNIPIMFRDAVSGNQGGFNGFQIKAVPEPSIIALLTGGLISLLAYAWRKRR